MVGVLTAEQANEYWITVRRDHYWLDLGMPWDEAIQRARHDWAVIHPNGGGSRLMSNIDWTDRDVDHYVLDSGQNQEL